MQTLISELNRLYLLDNQRHCLSSQAGDHHALASNLTPEILAQHLSGEKTVAIELATAHGMTRTMVMDFHWPAHGDGSRLWEQLCEVANALQGQLDLPAPAVSISGDRGYGLWLSLDSPVPVAQAGQFLQSLRSLYCADLEDKYITLLPSAESSHITTRHELPPCLHQASGKWAAFINPSMGAAFTEEAGLDMPPPSAAQAAFLSGIHNITAAQFTHALDSLTQNHRSVPDASHPVPVRAQAPETAPEGLLLKDATLEDIVRFLHAKNIEPTFRHLIATAPANAKQS